MFYKKLILTFSNILITCYSFGQANEMFSKLNPTKPGENVATFAGGCFWALEEGMSELKGVNNVTSGYAGGTTKNPTYEQVGSLKTGHAEAVQVYYDPKIITYAELVKAFLFAHDPTQLNKQGPDIGTDYRSVAFYRNEQEKKIIEQEIAKVNTSKHYQDRIVTDIVPFTFMYPAETYHQDYYRLHPNQSYIVSVSKKKVMKLRESCPDLIKPEFKKK